MKGCLIPSALLEIDAKIQFAPLIMLGKAFIGYCSIRLVTPSDRSQPKSLCLFPICCNTPLFPNISNIIDRPWRASYVLVSQVI